MHVGDLAADEHGKAMVLRGLTEGADSIKIGVMIVLLCGIGSGLGING